MFILQINWCSIRFGKGVFYFGQSLSFYGRELFMDKADFNKNIFILEREDSKTILYNSFTGEIFRLDSNLGDVDLDKDNTLKNYFDENYFLQQKNHFPVSKYIENTRKKLSSTDRSASFTIHLTYSCNCKCFYCYQNDIRKKIQIDGKTENSLYEFFEKVIEANSLEVVSFIFIGGEPLLCINSLLRIREKSEKIFKGIKKSYSIITNGCLLTEHTVSLLSEYEWDYLQVTLDGAKEFHDKIRIKKDNTGTFDNIIAGIINCTKNKLPICVNYNLSENSYNYLESLLAYFKEKNINVHLEFSQVFECNGDFKKNKNHTIFDSNIWYKAHSIARSYGYLYEPFYRMSYMLCGKNRINDFNISPDGKLYKCISGVGIEKYCVGTLEDYNTELYKQKLNSFIDFDKLPEKCHNCMFEIVCGGWCSYKKEVYGDYCPYKELQENDLKLLMEDLSKI